METIGLTDLNPKQYFKNSGAPLGLFKSSAVAQICKIFDAQRTVDATKVSLYDRIGSINLRWLCD